MFWAVQGMAAEFSTGFLCAEKIRKSGKKISMLVVHKQAEFTKKQSVELLFLSSRKRTGCRFTKKPSKLEKDKL